VSDYENLQIFIVQNDCVALSQIDEDMRAFEFPSNYTGISGKYGDNTLSLTIE
jgi:hypothetical protein